MPGKSFRCSIGALKSEIRKIIRLGAVLFALGVVGGWGWDYWRGHRYDALILAAARRYEMDPALVKAVVWQESRFNAGARGQAGELGLMQIREAAASEWAKAEHLSAFDHAQCLDPATNTLAGSWYLRKLLLRYSGADNPAVFALADYNAGRGNVLKWLDGAPPAHGEAFIPRIGFPKTRDYIRAILRRAEQYRPM